MTNNQAFLQQAVEHAEANLREPTHVLTALLQYPNATGEPDVEVVTFGHMLNTNGGNEPDLAGEARRAAKHRGAQRVALINEAWLAGSASDAHEPMVLAHKYECPNADFDSQGDVQAFEIMSIMVEEQDGTMLGALYEIVDEPQRRLGENLTGSGYTQPGRFWRIPSLADARKKHSAHTRTGVIAAVRTWVASLLRVRSALPARGDR